MNNFTKSIVYSGVVLAAGLVAIFAIYNNMGTDGSNVSYIEPAAGEETFTESVSEAYDNTVEAIAETAEDAEAAITGETDTEATAEAEAEEPMSAEEKAIKEADMSETPDEVETQQATDNSPEDRTAKGEDLEQTEPASGDQVIENAKELLEEKKAEESAE